MPELKWDQVGEKTYETGVKKGVHYPIDENGAYSKGYAWNGLTNVAENPSGAEETPLYADDQKYLSLYSAETFGATVQAYTYPDSFALCDGSSALDANAAVMIGQQDRKAFGMSYVTTKGNDTQGNGYGYIIHLIYGATASPSQKSYDTINDSPNAVQFSWELKTTPVPVTGHKSTASLTIDSTKFPKEKRDAIMKAIEDVLYGTSSTEARLPLPDEVLTIIDNASKTQNAAG